MKITLKPGKEKSIKQRHHWIFSGAIQIMPKIEPGEVLPVYANDKQLLGHAYFNPTSSIAGRMISFGDADPVETLRRQIKEAIEIRKMLFPDPQVTNAYRLINSEGDSLPGLIVDQYADVLVVQVTTQGMEKLFPQLLDTLIESIKPRAIIEKSTGPSRQQENLKNQIRILYGTDPGLVEIRENKLNYVISIIEGQKTGFFLDHREMRQALQKISHGRKVLNCFSYTGGFSIAASAGGAKTVHSVDISDEAIHLAQENAKLNHQTNHTFEAADVFTFLRETPTFDYDLIILDPPAFAKKQKDVITACRGYKDINRIAMQRAPKNSILLTSSCSYHVDPSLFQKVIFQAALEAGREVSIIGRHIQAPDHPINIYHPEGEYLKSLQLVIK